MASVVINMVNDAVYNVNSYQITVVKALLTRSEPVSFSVSPSESRIVKKRTAWDLCRSSSLLLKLYFEALSLSGDHFKSETKSQKE